jgi:hypothetical protein
MYDNPNCPVDAPALNPLPENAKTADCGDAGRDGYTVLARANRYNGERPISGRDDPHASPLAIVKDY